jgi:hypothetical protein
MAQRLDRLLIYLATELPGCTEADKKVELLSAFGEFCQRSRCWREELSVTVEADDDISRVPLAWTSGDGIASEILSLTVDGSDVLGRWRALVGLRRDDAAGQVLSMRRPPVEGRAWVLGMEAVLVPRDDAAHGPDWIVDTYGRGIAQGALAQLKRHAKKSYTDRDGAAACERRFVRAIAEAAMDGQNHTITTRTAL